MDYFESETLTSDSSPSCSSPTVSSTTEIRTRKIRATEEFVPPEITDLQPEIKQIARSKQNLSFLPKIDDLVDDFLPTKTDAKLRRVKVSIPKKKTAPLKLDRLKIGKKPTYKTKSKKSGTEKLKNKSITVNSSKVRKLYAESDELIQVLSDAAEEFISDTSMNLKLKREKGSWKSISKGEEDRNIPKIVFKKLYVNLVPLEKTNLLTEKQLQQLQCKKVLSNALLPLSSASYSNCRAVFNRSTSSSGKENLLGDKTVDTSATDSFYEYYRPCKVILERLNFDQMASVKRKSRRNSGSKSNIHKKYSKEDADIIDKTRLVKRKTVSLHVSKIKPRKTYRRHTMDSVKTPRFSCASKNLDESYLKFTAFRPEESSSPLISRSGRSANKNSDTSRSIIVVLKQLTREQKSDEATDNREHTESYEIKGHSSANGQDEVLEVLRDVPSFNTQELSFINELQKSHRTSSELFLKGEDDEPASIREDGTFEVNDVYTKNWKTEGHVPKNSSAGDGNHTFEVGSLDFKCKSPDLAEQVINLNRKSLTELSKHQENDSVKRTKQRSFSLDVQGSNCSNIDGQAAEVIPTKKRRSTLTLEDSVNDISVLKSTCDSAGTPQKLSIVQKRRHSVSNDIIKPQQVLFRKVLNKNLKSISFHESVTRKESLTSNHHDFSNVTIRKQTPYVKKRISIRKSKTSDALQSPNFKSNLENTLPMWEGHSELKNGCAQGKKDKPEIKKRSTVFRGFGSSNFKSILENTSPPWDSNTEFNDGSTYEVEESKLNKTDNKLSTTLEKTPRQPDSSDKDSDVELDKSSDEDGLASSSVLSSARLGVGKRKLRLTYDTSSIRGDRVIDNSSDIDSDDDFELSSTSSNTKKVAKRKSRVTFGTTRVIDHISDNSPLSTTSTTLPTPKSVLKSKNSHSPSANNRRVRFSNMSVIIIDDSDVSRGSPVPTNFPPDDDSDDSTEDFPRKDCISTAGRTPARSKKSAVSPEYDRKGIQSPIRSRKTPAVEIIRDKKLKTPSQGKGTSNGSLVLNKSKTTPKPKRTKLPNFAKIHQKMFDTMESIKEYSERKEKQAQLLLSGTKPQRSSLMKKDINKQIEAVTAKLNNKVRSKKQLKYPEEATTSKDQSTKRGVKKPNLISSTPKGKTDSYTRYGFKIIANKSPNKQDQIMAIANKVKPPKSSKDEKRAEIRGVRSNRRFDLLMKMRENKQK